MDKELKEKIAKLTPKQQKFCEEYIRNGGNGTEAVRLSYDVKNDNVAKSIAQENLTKPAISEAMARWREITAQKFDLDFESMAATLGHIAATNIDSEARTAVTACAEINKMFGHHKTTQHVGELVDTFRDAAAENRKKRVKDE